MKQKQKQKQNKSVMYIFLEGTAGLFAILMLGFFPLFYQNNYIDISGAKLTFFKVCAIGLVIFTALFAGMEWIQRFKEKIQEEGRHNGRKSVSRSGKGEKTTHKEMKAPQKEKSPVRKWLSGVSVTTWFAVIFVAGICIATVFSVNPLESWQGNEGRKLGAMVFLLCIAMYGVLGKYLKTGKWLAGVFFISNIIVFLLAILNFWAIDPLHMYGNLVENQHGGFISTIGNVNACASYLCMVLPVGMVLYAQAKTKVWRGIAAVFLVLGFWTSYCSRSNSWLLGVGTAFLVLLWYALCEHEKMKRFLEICGLFWLTSVLMKITLLIGEKAGSKSLMFLNLRVDTLAKLLLNGYILAVVGILLAGAIFYIWNMEKRNKELPYRRMRRVIFTVLAAVAAFGILAFAVANLNQETWKGALSWLNRLKLQDSFGSSRGYIWKITIAGWLDMPLWDKLTGYGVNCYHMFIQQYGGEGVAAAFGGAQLIDAHNEFMQFLTTTGVLGVVGYFGLLISTAVVSAKKSADKPVLVMGVAVVCSYLAQGMVNNPTVFLTPYLFLMLGIIKSMERMEDVGE